MKVVLANLALRGVAGALPPNTTDLASLKGEFGEDDVERIMSATGIRCIRVSSPGQCASDLCEAAARSLLNALDVPAQSIDGIVFVSQTPDYLMPATSVLLQHRLGLPKASAAFDINYGCSGFVYGLLQSAMLVATGSCRRVLLLAGDVMSRHLNPGDKANRMVFGDGGSAALVERGHSRWHFQTWTDGSGGPSLIIPAGGARLPLSEQTARAETCGDGYPRSLEQLHMQGTKVVNFAVREVPTLIGELARAMSTPLPEIGFIGLHQANRYMVRTIRRVLELPEQVVPADCGDFGNTGPASIPLLLSSRAGKLPESSGLERSILCGFGVGYSVAGVGLSLAETECVLPVVADSSRNPFIEEARGMHA